MRSIPLLPKNHEDRLNAIINKAVGQKRQIALKWPCHAHT